MVQSFLWPQEGASIKTRTGQETHFHLAPHTGMGTDVMHTTRMHTQTRMHIRAHAYTVKYMSQSYCNAPVNQAEMSLRGGGQRRLHCPLSKRK